MEASAIEDKICIHGLLRGAAGTVELMPPKHIAPPLFGFRWRTGPAKGVRDPLFANALVVSNEHGRTAVLMTLDTLYIGPRLSERLALLLLREFGIPSNDFLLAASHTHFAPALDHTKPDLGLVDDTYFQWVAARCENFLRELLAKTPNEVNIQAASGEWNGPVCRRRPWPFPRLCRWKLVWGEPVMAPFAKGPNDRTLRLWVLSGNDRRIQAIIWNCACHPTGQPEDFEISADYCAAVRKSLFQEIGHDVPVLFFQGFAGDQRPNVPESRPLTKRIVRAFIAGPSFAAFDEASWDAWLNDLKIAIGKLFKQATNAKSTRAAGMIESTATDIPLSDVIDGRNNFSRNVKFQRISLGNLFDLFCVSAEPSTELQKLIPFRGAIPVGYIGDVFGYWPTERQRQEGGYEAGLFFEAFSLNGRFRADLDKKFADAALRLAQPK